VEGRGGIETAEIMVQNRERHPGSRWSLYDNGTFSIIGLSSGRPECSNSFTSDGDVQIERFRMRVIHLMAGCRVQRESVVRFFELFLVVLRRSILKCLGGNAKPAASRRKYKMDEITA